MRLWFGFYNMRKYMYIQRLEDRLNRKCLLRENKQPNMIYQCMPAYAPSLIGGPSWIGGAGMKEASNARCCQPPTCLPRWFCITSIWGQIPSGQDHFLKQRPELAQEGLDSYRRPSLQIAFRLCLVGQRRRRRAKLADAVHEAGLPRNTEACP